MFKRKNPPGHLKDSNPKPFVVLMPAAAAVQSRGLLTLLARVWTWRAKTKRSSKSQLIWSVLNMLVLEFSSAYEVYMGGINNRIEAFRVIVKDS